MTESVSESSAPILSNSTMKKSIKILHVDDDPSFLKVTKQCLETQGEFEVDTASSVNEAQGKLEKTDYDAVVSDYQMSGKDGLEFLKELREKGNTVPFIVFTGKGREQVAITALNLGADQYIDKHGDPETVYHELAHAIRQAVDRKSAQIESLKREAKLKAILESSPEAITVTDLNGNIIEFNQATVVLHGYESKEELIGKNSLELIAKQDHKRAIEGLKETLEHGSTKNLEYTFLTKDGREFQAELSASVVRDATGKPEYFMAITKDITERKKAEEALRESMEIYRELAESISDMFFAMDKDFRYTYWNQASEKFTGVSAKDAIGKSLTEVFPDVKGTRVEQFYKEALRTQQPQSFLNKYQLKGKDYVFELNAYPTKTGLSVFVKDVTERQKMDDEIKSLARFPSENPNPVLRLNREGNILYANNPGKALLQDWKHEVADRTPEFLRGVVAETLSKQSEKSFDLKLGKRVYSITVTPVMGSDYANIYGTDITERKKAGEELFDELSLMQLLLENHPDFIYFKDSEARFQRVSKRFCDFFELDKEDIIGKTDLELFPEEVAKQTYSEDLQIIKTGKPIINKEENAKGTWVLTTKMPRFDKNGKIVGLFGISRDITERKKAGEELRNSEERLSILFELAPDAYYLNDLKGNFVDGNKAAEEVTGYTKNELIGKNFLKLKLLPRSQALKAAKLLAMNALGKPTGPDELVLNRKDGTQVPVEIRTHPIKIKDRTLVLSIARDITVRKEKEKEIQESQQKFEGVFRHNPEAAVYLDVDFRILDVNPRFCQLFGYSAEEVKGENINDVVAPESLKEEAESLNRDARNGYASHDSVRKRKDGSLIHVSISAAPVTFEDNPLGYVGIYKDITKLKDTEERLREMNKKLEVTNEKLYVVGSLTRHDVRNKLSAVTGNAYLLKRKLAGDAKALEQLSDMEAATRLAEEIFEFARTYEKLGIEQLLYLDAGKAFDEASSLFTDLKGVKIVNECNGLNVLADSLLRQLFYNLIDNSLKHGEKAGQIRIYSRTPSADKLELVYEDDGVGIPNDIRSSLFKEGFTSGKGTGYGLFMMKRICEVYGWTIRETGKQGKGAQFTINIPKAKPDGRPNCELG